MDAVKLSEYLPEAVSCSLCLNVFKDPVTLECGHNYCSTCIQQRWGGAQSNVFCPQCKEKFANVTLRPNRQLGNVSWLIQELQQKEVVMARKRGLCEVHQVPMQLFCCDDLVLLCTECERSQAHASHVHSSVEEAAHNLKREIKVLIELQKLQKQDLRDNFSEVQKEKGTLEKIIDLSSHRFASEYKEFYETVRKVQTDQLALAKAAGKEVDHETSQLVKKYEDLKAFMRKLEKKWEEPAGEFVQDVKGIMSRCRAALVEPMGCDSLAFKEKIWAFSLRSLFLCSTLKKCRESLLLESKVERANVTLDRVTAHGHLLISPSRKIVTHDSGFGCLVTKPRSFDSTPCVLGEQSFATGTHYWEVEITSPGEGWALGVMKESAERKGEVTLSPHEGIWALQAHHLPSAWRQPGTIRLRVYLDYEAGTVHFFNAASREPVALLSYAIFLGERVFPFFMLEQPNTQMKVVF